MSMLCAISGEAPTNPVASSKSGTVFEKRLIEAYIAEHGKDPVTGEELSTADLIELKSSTTVRPRPPTLTSIPALLATFQNEWDALALETHTLRQQVTQLRQELSTALYQHDAATRVIARLLKERDEARDALSHVTVGAGATTGGEQMEVDTPQVPEYIQSKIDATKAELSADRKNRPVSAEWATSETISSFSVTSTSDALYPGAKSISLDVSGDLALLGGSDGNAGIYSISQQQVITELNSSDGAINDVAWAGSNAVTGSSSGVVKVWNQSGSDSTAMTAHAGPVVALAVHPSKSVVASAGADKSWALYDIEAGKSVVQVYDQSKFTTAAFHPDGHLFALGTPSEVKVFDVRSTSLGASLEPVSSGVKSLCFSENGFWLAVAQQEQSTVEIWDLRKMRVTKSLDIGSRVDHLAWDYSGQFLAVAGKTGVSVQQYTKADKKWSEPFRGSAQALATAWGTKARSLVTVDVEGRVSVLGA
ncbi:WD40-repeat-containing domain protein [Pyronema omphalodes]|nr:WD40-repeat-containing domain protein [Pyronema omphalodes]